MKQKKNTAALSISPVKIESGLSPKFPNFSEVLLIFSLKWRVAVVLAWDSISPPENLQI
jgi:hypothetical protein